MQDRRAHQRIRITRKVGIVQSNGEVVYAWTFDLSLGGMQICTEYSADLDAEFDAFMGIFDPIEQTHVVIDMRVKVVHLLYDGSRGCYRIGMRFLRFKRDGRERLERFMEGRLASPLANHD